MATTTASRSRSSTPGGTGSDASSLAAVDSVPTCGCGQPLDAWQFRNCSRCGVRVTTQPPSEAEALDRHRLGAVPARHPWADRRRIATDRAPSVAERVLTDYARPEGGER
jgi:hypothetical protein